MAFAEPAAVEPFIAGFERAATLKPDKPLAVVGRGALTYGVLLDRSARLARLWADAGLRQGDRVVVASRDDREVALFFLALIRCGLTAVVIDPFLPAHAARRTIDAAGARGLVIDGALREEWQPGGERHVLEIRSAGGRGATLFHKLLRGRPAEPAPPGAYPAVLDRTPPWELPGTLPGDLVAYVLFTSGTTARPRGVQITHASLAHHLGTLSRRFGYDRGSRILDVLPLHHTDGLIQGPVAAFWNGATVHRPLTFSIPHIGQLLDAIYAERITHFVAVPTILALLLAFGREYAGCMGIGDFRFVISAAAQLEPDLWSRFERTFGTRVVNLYGLTETVTGGLFCGPADADFRIGTIGRPVDCEARIVDDAGADAPDGAPGELLIRGGNVMKGYLDDPEATAAALGGGWLHTGDIATRDGDGFYRIVGRRKNIVITGGINVHPEEAVEALNTHPQVLESCAFGVPDPTWGEVLVAAVVLAGGAEATAADLMAHCRGRLAPAAVPHRITVLSELPKGPAGKVVVDRVREQVAGAARATEKPGGDVRGRLYAIAARSFNVPAQSLDRSSGPDSTPGWDSLAHFSFLLELEESFGIRLSHREIMALVNLDEAERIITAKLAGR